MSEPVPLIHAKMAAILRDVDAVGKNTRNISQNFMYRGIDDLYNAINPVLAKHGVYMTAQILHKTREERVTKRSDGKDSVLAFTCLRMRYRFYAEDGSFVETEVEGEGMDSGDKSSNKAMAIGHKYALLQAFCIPTKDLDDPDAHVHVVAPKAAPVIEPSYAYSAAKPVEAVVAAPTKEQIDASGTWARKALADIPKIATSEELSTWGRKHDDTLAKLERVNPDAFHAVQACLADRYGRVSNLVAG